MNCRAGAFIEGTAWSFRQVLRLLSYLSPGWKFLPLSSHCSPPCRVPLPLLALQSAAQTVVQPVGLGFRTCPFLMWGWQRQTASPFLLGTLKLVI